MWFYVPPENDKAQPWIGRLTISGQPRASGTFELVRHVEFVDLYKHQFEGNDLIVGLLDLQRRSTLIRPIITRIDPGTLDNFSRTRLEGQFQGLLTGFAVSDSKQAQFQGFSFSSAAFRSWYGGGAQNIEWGRDQTTITLPKPDLKEFTVDAIGKVACASSTRLSRTIWSSEIQSDAVCAVTFDTLKSLDELQEYCFAFDALFRFLAGYPGPPPSFNVWLDQEQDVGNGRMVKLSGDLQIFGQDWIDDRPPVRGECLHSCDDGVVGIKSILTTFLPSMPDMLAWFHAVSYCRFHSSNISDKFAVIMPVLEELVRRKYETNDETVYRELEQGFFAWLDTNASPEFKQFSRKHLAVKDSKAASLPTLLGRAIAAVNAKGFNLPKEYARRLNSRRAKHFHSVPQFITAEDARRFYDEVRAATALLLLSTLDDLGIDIAPIALRPEALNGFADLLVQVQPRGY